MDILKMITSLYETSVIYKGFAINLPYPFNDVYLGTLITGVIILLFITYIVGEIRALFIRKRVRKLQKERRLKRLEEENIREEEKKQELERQKQRDEWMKAIAQGFITKSVSFEEWQSCDDKNKDDSLHDKETGLYNSLAFAKHFEKIPLSSLAIVYADINDLNKTNTTLGKKYGDKLLNAVASEISEQFPEKAYRKGGDEFVVLLDGMGEKIIRKKMSRIQDALCTRTSEDPDGIVYSCAFGISIGNGMMSRNDLLSLAEERMKKDKSSYKESCKDDGYTDARVTSHDESLYDALTGVWNRKAYENEVIKINETYLTVVYADIDGLKLVNDRLSHAAGDKLISAFAALLNKEFADCVYRIADDDFAVLIYNVDEESVARKIDNIKAEMLKLTDCAEPGMFYSASFGIASNGNSDGGNGFLYNELIDTCEIMLKADKESFHIGKRSGVVIENDELKRQCAGCNNREPVYAREEIINSKRSDYSLSEPEPEFKGNNALSSILSDLKKKTENKQREDRAEEIKRLESIENEERIDSNIKEKYNRDDNAINSGVLSNKVSDENKKIKKELNKLKKSGKPIDSTNKGTDRVIKGNTVSDVDI